MRPVLSPTLRAQIGGVADSWRLGGAVDFVSDADLADHLVASAADGERTVGFVVPLADRRLVDRIAGR